MVPTTSDFMYVTNPSATPAPRRKVFEILAFERYIVSVPMDEGPAWRIVSSPFAVLRSTASREVEPSREFLNSVPVRIAPVNVAATSSASARFASIQSAMPAPRPLEPTQYIFQKQVFRKLFCVGPEWQTDLSRT